MAPQTWSRGCTGGATPQRGLWAVHISLRWFIVGGVFVALCLAVGLSPFASSNPDGLNKVAEDHGFIDQAEDHALTDSPVAGYAVKGVADEKVSKALSGLIGVLVTFEAALLLSKALRARRSRAPNTQLGG